MKRGAPKKATKKQALKEEYQRLERNLRRRITRAVKEGRTPQPETLPKKPKRITEASIRKLKKLSESFWRGPKKKERPRPIEQPPINPDIIQYDNFIAIIEEAATWTGELLDWVQRYMKAIKPLNNPENFTHWITMVNEAGHNAKDMADDAFLKLKHSNGLSEEQALHFFVNRISDLYRRAYGKFEFYLHGYMDPDAGQKASYFLTISQILNRDLTPQELDMVYQAAMSGISEDFEELD